jgi:nitrite reductase (NADH) small subunit
MSEYLCRLSELEEARPRLVRVEGRAVAVVRIGGDVFAIGAVCPHWGGPLADGQVSAARAEIVCPWHRFRYSLRDGRCVAATARPGAVVISVHIEGDAVVAGKIDDAHP